MVLKTILLF